MDFQGVGGSPELRNNQPQRGGGLAGEVPLSLLGFMVGTVVAGDGGAVVAWGSPEKKLDMGGPRGMAGAAADRRWGVFSGRAGRRTTGRGRRGAAIWPVVAGDSGGWRLKMNRRPLISYPTAAKSTDQRLKRQSTDM